MPIARKPRPELVASLAAEAAQPPVEPTAVAKRAAREQRRVPPELPPIHAQLDHVIRKPDDESLPIRSYHPAAGGPYPALVWFHGGGWVLGDMSSGDLAGREIASRANCIVVSVDYRLAPETRFPGAFEDCLFATRWVIERGAHIGIDPTRVAVGGDSAGGNLAACVATAAAGHGLRLCHQLLVYPVIIPTLDTDSCKENAEGYGLTTQELQWCWDQYTAPSDRTDPRVAPMNADLGEAPSAWIYTAGLDPLRDDGIRYGDALDEAGVSVERMNVDDTIHGIFNYNFESGAEARAAAAESLRRAFERGS